MEASKMTLLSGSVRLLLLTLSTTSPVLLALPGFGEENPDIVPQISSATLKKDEPITQEKSKKPPLLSETRNLYLGNKFSQKYHLKGCHFAQIADPGNIFPFASCKEAINSNYLPCNWCLPKWQKFVKGQIIGLPINRKADAKKSSSQ